MKTEFPTLMIELLAEVCKICIRIYICIIGYMIYYILYINIYMFFQQIMSINASWSIGIEGKHHTKMHEFSLDWQIFSVVLFTDFVPNIGICSN